MYKVIAVYRVPTDDVKTQFEDHFKSVHTPICLKIPGIKEVRTNKIFGGPTGASNLSMVVEMCFENKDSWKAAMKTPEMMESGKDAMKLFLIGILASTLSFAGELKTSFSDSQKSFDFNLYELSTPGEYNSLWTFINTLYLGTEMNGMSLTREFVSQNKDFSFKCVQTYATGGENEAVCVGKLLKTSQYDAFASVYEGTPKFLSMTLRENIAKNFSAIFVKNNGVTTINLRDKFIVTGTNLFVEMEIRE